MGVNNGPTINRSAKGVVAPGTVLVSAFTYTVPTSSLLIVESLNGFMAPFGSPAVATGLLLVFVSGLELMRLYNPPTTQPIFFNIGELYVQAGEQIDFQWSNAAGGVNTFMLASFKGRLLN